GVAIDEAGQDNLAGGVDDFGIGRRGRQIGGGAEPFGCSVPHQQTTVGQDLTSRATPSPGGLPWTFGDDELSSVTNEKGHSLSSLSSTSSMIVASKAGARNKELFAGIARSSLSTCCFDRRLSCKAFTIIPTVPETRRANCRAAVRA